MAITEKEKQILETFERVLPGLTEKEKERLLYMGKGMLLKTERILQEQGEASKTENSILPLSS